jgi:hypothetical protein
MEVRIKRNTLHIMLDLEDPTPSATGKTEVVAGTGGRWRSGLKINGKPLWLIATAYIYPDKTPDRGRKKGNRARRKNLSPEKNDGE